MSKPISTHGTCPYCGHNDCFTLWEDGGYLCHSCGAKPKGLKKEVVEVEEKHKNTTYRNLSQKAVDKYGITTAYRDGKEYARDYPYPHKSKRRILPKDFSDNKGFTNDHLFGMDKFNSGSSKFITIVEGEDDAPAAYDMLGCKYPVVAIPGASISNSLLKNCHSYLDKFENIVVATDGDDAGEAAATRLADAFPNRVYRVSLTKHNDPMEYLESGDASDFQYAWYNRTKYVPKFDTSTPDQYISILRESKDDDYISSGIEAYDEQHLGLFQGHVTMFQAPEGSGKCLHPDQEVLMSDGSVRKAKDVETGDILMGPNSEKRTVLSTTTGKEEMFKITPVKGEPWICNRSHILSLVESESGRVVNISVDDYLKKSKWFKQMHLQYREPVDTFYNKTYNIFDPYVVGVYLGDGHTHSCAISVGKKKLGIKEYVENYFSKCGFDVYTTFNKNCYRVNVSNNWKREGSFWTYIKDYVEPRRIPMSCKTGSKEDRQKVLAGLLDTDGSLSGATGCEITQKSEGLADDICFVARSLGLAAYKKTKVVDGKDYYRVSISGDLTGLPTLRLKFPKRQQKKNVLRTSITVESLGVGEYAGFCLDGDKRFLLGDFTVTHNTELIHFFEHHILKNYPDIPFAACHLEETKKRTTLAWVSYDLHKNVTRKDLIQDVGEVEDSIRRLTKNENAHLFSIGTDEDPMVLLDRVKYYVNVCGCKYVFIEPIQDLAQQYHGPDNTERFLSKIAVGLARIATEYDVGIIMIAHENDDGLVSDCRKLSKQASVVVKLERDIDNTDEEIRNTTTLVSKKNRPSAFVGYGGQLKFDPETFTLEEKWI